MQWTDAVDAHLQALKPATEDPALAQRLYSLIDLTSLNETDTEASIASVCQKAQSTLGHVAAVCLYPSFVSLAAANLSHSKVKIATVANFPSGDASLENVLVEINNCMLEGATEVDVVFPYARYLAGEQHYAHHFVQECKATCGDQALLKVILETGALIDPGIIADASYTALAAGADFIKTSTGKIAEGASLQAAAVMLMVIKHTEPQVKHRLGFKAAGGIRTMQEAAQYLALADQIMGDNWVTPETFRIGASQLVDVLLSSLISSG